jgi:hypothetical protein
MTQHTDLFPYDTPPAPRVPDSAGTTRPGGVQNVVAPFSVNIGHSLELSALALIAVGLKLAYDHRGRDVEAPVQVPLADEEIYPIRLSDWLAMTEADSTQAKRSSFLSLLQEMTTRGIGRRSRVALLQEMTIRS